MSRTLKLNFIVPACVAAAGLLAMQVVNPGRGEPNERQFAEQVNLALRQTAHRLLAVAGDRTSAIPPVQQLEKNTWLVRLERDFDYDSLPPILQTAFAAHHIGGEYNVAVLDCQNDELMLGYSFNPLIPNAETACGGREQMAGCYNLRVTFPDFAATPFEGKTAWILLAFVCSALLLFSAYHLFIFLKKKDLSEKKPLPVVSSSGQNPIRFGKSTLLIDNQKLLCNGAAKDLTYREAKLLLLFSRHANQLLERDSILKSVWEDEGVIVGRSVDVFVSRLRKLLKDDDTVRIVNVHGVGYRMEVSA